MKATRKLLAALLTLVMAAALVTAPAAAEEPADGSGSGTDTAAATGTITITGANEGKTYTIYKILKLESYNADSGAYAYKYEDAWEGFFTDGGDGEDYVDIDAQGYVTWKTTITESNAAATFAASALAYAEENSINNAGSTMANSDKVTFSGLDLGYYLVKSEMGALCHLSTTDPNVNIAEKNQLPRISKQAGDAQINNAKVGDTVNFTVTVTTEAGENKVPAPAEGETAEYAKDYVLHDTMGSGFSFDSTSVQVTYTPVGGTAQTLAAGTDTYTITTTGLGDNCTFEIDFADTFEKNLNANDEITITYTATLTENAVDSQNNTNSAKMTYGTENKDIDVETKTYTFAFEVYKFTGTGDDEKGLAGAEFQLLDANKSPVSFVKAKNADGNELANTYTYSADGANGSITTITTSTDNSANGTFTLQGLSAGTYYLKETKAPAGYNELAGPIKVVIEAATDGNGQQTGAYTVKYYTYNATTKGYDTDPTKTLNSGTPLPKIQVENKTGSELPSTGGVGTTVFYVAGGILVTAAVVLLVVRKRMDEE